MKIALIGLALFVLMSTITVADDEPPKFKVTTKRDTDRVEVKGEKSTTVFSVHSPFGISQAVIERRESTWPESMLLRLHLKGLESFRATNGKVTLDAAVSNQGGKVRIWKDGREDSPLDAKCPYWMEICLVDGDGNLTKEVPLKDGSFEIRLPKAFFEGNPNSIKVNWIDFYR
jgi:hypothetical protein